MNDVVRRAQQGDDEAFIEVCGRFEGLVKKHVYQPHLIPLYEDGYAEAWLAVAEAVKSYDEASGVRFAGYVESKVRFAIWNLFKRERRRWQNETLLAEGSDDSGENFGLRLEMLSDKANVEREVELKFINAELGRAMAVLPGRQREVIVKTMANERKLTEVAQELGITVQAVHNLRQRGIARLKKACAGMYVSERG